MIKHLGFPKCVSNEPFTMVETPAELREWRVAHPEEAKAQDDVTKARKPQAAKLKKSS